MTISLHPDTPDGRTLAASPVLGASPTARSATKTRSRLFTKYVALFVAVVAVALLSNGMFEVFFYYREHKVSLIRIQHEQAEAAAAKISQFIKKIESQLGWTTQLPWSAGSIEQRRFDALRLLRQVPAITELAQVDSTGKERLRVSRLAMDVVDSGLDLSKDPKFTEAVARKVYYGPVYFRRESEPYMTMALAGTRKDAGVSIAEVNLKLIWDVVSQIKVGEHGHAYVVGSQGRLIAHPDISLVLRNTDMSQLSQVQAARAERRNDSLELQGTKNIQGQEVLTASAPIAPLGWTMFVELPVEEAYASLYQALQRLAVVLLAASIFAVLAGVFLARRMVGPIQALRVGAERIGSGDFAQRISIRTGDELEGLANQFNDMGARLQESYTDLENKVETRTGELKESLEYQTATADVLNVISRSTTNVQPVFDSIATSAARLFAPCETTLITVHDGQLHWGATASLGRPVEAIERVRSIYPIPFDVETSPSARAVTERRIIEIWDVSDPDTPESTRRAGIAGGFRSVTFVPLLRDGIGIGTIILTHPEAGFRLSPKQLTLVQTFADQAVIAIENARLFDEVQAKTGELTEALTYQTGSGNILKVIASSPTDVKPALKAIVESACELLEADDALVALKDGKDLVFKEQHGSIPVVWDRIAISRDWGAGRAVVDCKPIHVHDLLSSDGEQFPESQDFARRTGVRTVLSVPLLRENESIGAIVLRRAEVQPFSEKQITLLQTFADQAVIAIGNVRLFDEVQARTKELTESLQFQTATSEVLKVISRSPDALQPVLDVIVKISQELCSSDASTIFLLRDGKFHVTAVAGIMPVHLDTLRANPAPVGQPGSILARIAREKRTLHYANVADDPELKAGITGRGGPRTLLTVPLMRDGEVMGAISMRRAPNLPFSGRQIEAIEAFADQAVIAISNVGLFEQVQERTRELTKSLDELRTAQDRLVQTEKLASLGQLTAGIAHEIKNPLNFVNNFSALSAELIDELNEALTPAPLDQKMRSDLGELTQTLKSNLEKVVQHGKRADSIVKNMLLHSREGSG